MASGPIAAIRRTIKRTFRIGKLPELRNSLLFTFDDGPEPRVTPGILDLLRDANARAVFFVIGRNAERYPEILRAIRDGGHLIGNHSYAHRRDLPVHECLADLHRCQRIVESATDVKPVLFRPPGGFHPVWSAAARLLGLRTVLFSVDSQDSRLKGEALLQHAAALGGSLAGMAAKNDIVLLHDDMPQVLPVLDRLLRPLLAAGCDLQKGISVFSTAPLLPSAATTVRNHCATDSKTAHL